MSAPREWFWPFGLYPVACVAFSAAVAGALVIGPPELRTQQGLGTVLLLGMLLLTVPVYGVALIVFRASFRALSPRATWLTAAIAGAGTVAALAGCLLGARLLATSVGWRAAGDGLFPFGAPLLAPLVAVTLAAVVARRIQPTIRARAG